MGLVVTVESDQSLTRETIVENTYYPRAATYLNRIIGTANLLGIQGPGRDKLAAAEWDERFTEQECKDVALFLFTVRPYATGLWPDDSAYWEWTERLSMAFDLAAAQNRCVSWH